MKSNRLVVSGRFDLEGQEAHEANDNARDIEWHTMPEALEQGGAQDWREHTRERADIEEYISDRLIREAKIHPQVKRQDGRERRKRQHADCVDPHEPGGRATRMPHDSPCSTPY